MVLRMACFFVVIGTVSAGLWPFRAPRNDLTWLGQGGGLFFGKHGAVVTARAFRSASSREDARRTLEIWLKPARIDGGGMIFSFYQVENFAVRMSLRQYKRGLVLERGELNLERTPFTGVYATDVFAMDRPVFLSITSGEAGTAVYVDERS